MSLRARGFVPLVALFLLGGCASSHSDETAGEYVGASIDDSDLESEGRDYDMGEAGEDSPADDMPADEVPDSTPDGMVPGDTASDPYGERAGTEDDVEGEAPPARIAFTAPTSSLRPIARGSRPEFPERARLAVVSVRAGQIEHLPKVVLDLQTLLRKEMGIKAVLSLGAPRLESVGLEELAAQAKAEGRALLLVDASPGPAGIKRVGYLLHTGTGTLLARYEVLEDQEGVDVSEDAEADLCARLGPAYSRLKD